MSALYEPAQPAPQYCAIAIWESCGRECASGGSTGQPTDWRRRLAHAECLYPSTRRAVLPARSALLLFSFAGGRRKVWKESAARPFARQRNLPRGASGLDVGPTPMHTPVTRSLFLLTLNQERQSVCGANGKDRRSATRSVRRGRNDRRGQPPARRPSPHPFAWSQALPSS
jgi:hypothetical protein